MRTIEIGAPLSARSFMYPRALFDNAQSDQGMDTDEDDEERRRRQKQR